ncbi:hypothetical protein PthBH41_03760 [Parageobacillus thermoglucosidasius]|nr:hypothetical protein PthBH41_03760 [Parageobacillus thermoglucosidasius]
MTLKKRSFYVRLCVCTHDAFLQHVQEVNKESLEKVNLFFKISSYDTNIRINSQRFKTFNFKKLNAP